MRCSSVWWIHKHSFSYSIPWLVGRNSRTGEIASKLAKTNPWWWSWPDCKWAYKLMWYQRIDNMYMMVMLMLMLRRKNKKMVDEWKQMKRRRKSPFVQNKFKWNIYELLIVNVWLHIVVVAVSLLLLLLFNFQTLFLRLFIFKFMLFMFLNTFFFLWYSSVFSSFYFCMRTMKWRHKGKTSVLYGENERVDIFLVSLWIMLKHFDFI